MYIFTEEQQNTILTSINNMLDQAREYTQGLDSMCDPDYLKGRGKYPISAIVYSGFVPDNQNIPGLNIQKIWYGRHGKSRSMPELYNRDVIIQFYSNTAGFSGSDEVINKIDAFGCRFEVIQFTVNQDTYQLEKLEQISFDGLTNARRAKVAERKILFEVTQVAE